MATPFRSAVDLLKQYAEYHRDQRNILTHFLGVPMIVFAMGVLLARPTVMLGGLALTPAWVLFALVALWYLTRGHLGIGSGFLVLANAGVGGLHALLHCLGFVQVGLQTLQRVGIACHDGAKIGT